MANSSILSFMVKLLTKKLNDSLNNLYLPKLIKEQNKFEPYKADDAPEFNLSENQSIKLTNIVITGISNTLLSENTVIVEGNDQTATITGTAIISSIKDKTQYPDKLKIDSDLILKDNTTDINGKIVISIKNSTFAGEVQLLPSSDNKNITSKVNKINFNCSVQDFIIEKISFADPNSNNWTEIIQNILNKDKHKNEIIKFIVNKLASEDIRNSFSELINKALLQI